MLVRTDNIAVIFVNDGGLAALLEDIRRWQESRKEPWVKNHIRLLVVPDEKPNHRR